jgi:hypothetical protein
MFFVMLPHPAFGHLLPLKETGEGFSICLLPHFAREKVPEGRMREQLAVAVDQILQSFLLPRLWLWIDIVFFNPCRDLVQAFLAGQHGFIFGR